MRPSGNRLTISSRWCPRWADENSSQVVSGKSIIVAFPSAVGTGWLGVMVAASSTSAEPTRERVAVITGGGTGIGAACAHRLAADGCRVVLVGRRRAPLDATADSVRSAG